MKSKRTAATNTLPASAAVIGSAKKSIAISISIRIFASRNGEKK
jgi:hypothetical protein